MVGFLVTLMKAGMVFALLALTVKMLRRYDRRRFGTTSRKQMGTRPRTTTASSSRSSRSPLGLFGSSRWSRTPRAEPVLNVVERAPLGRNSSVILVRVQDQHFLFGVTDSQISMLLEVDVANRAESDESVDLPPGTPADQQAARDIVGQPVSFGAELLRQVRQYLPGTPTVENIDTTDLLGEVNP